MARDKDPDVYPISQVKTVYPPGVEPPARTRITHPPEEDVAPRFVDMEIAPYRPPVGAPRPSVPVVDPDDDDSPNRIISTPRPPFVVPPARPSVNAEDLASLMASLVSGDEVPISEQDWKAGEMWLTAVGALLRKDYGADITYCANTNEYLIRMLK